MSLAACADLVRRGDPDRWLSLTTVSEGARRRLLPLYAFNLEVARAPWVSPEPMIAQMRLQWWRDALQEIAEGTAPRRHEVVSPLAAVLSPKAAADLDVLVLMRHRDLDPAPFADVGALQHYLAETGGRLLLSAASVLHAGHEGLSDAGYAGALAAYFRAVAELRARARRPLPDERPETLKALAEEGLERWNTAHGASVDHAAIPALRALWRTPAILSLAAKDPQRILRGGLDTSPARRHATLLRCRLTRSW